MDCIEVCSPRRGWRIGIAVCGVVGLAVLASCDGDPVGPAARSSYRIRAVIVADWSPNGYASAAASDAVRAVASTGAGTAVLISTAYQSDVRSGAPAVDPRRTPGGAALDAAALAIRARGMSVIVKPHVDLDSGAWRGSIRPGDPDRWFSAYRDFILPLARWADAVRAPVFIIGTELAGTVQYESNWRTLIEEVRGVFGGALVYGASWDEVGQVAFWDALDFIGIDFYAPVAVRQDAGRLELLGGWQRWLVRINRISRRIGHRVLFTEIGYRAVDGAGQRPYDFATPGRRDEAEQADLYWAALTALAGKSWVEGICWWNWPAVAPSGTTTGYNPAGNVAEGVLRDSWSSAAR